MHCHHISQVSKAFIILCLGDRVFLEECIEGFLLISKQLGLLPTFLCIERINEIKKGEEDDISKY